MTADTTRSRLALTAAMDAAAVVAFAAVGKRSHDESGGAAGMLATAAPFLIALAVVWLAALGRFRPLANAGGRLVRPEAGVIVALATTAVGMVLRRTLWDRGTALTFVIVTAMFLAVTFGGLRRVRSFVAQRSNRGEARISGDV